MAKLTQTDIERAERRKRNLDKVVGNFGVHGRVTSFCEQYDLNPTYITQLLNGTKRIGDKSARNLEGIIGLKPYTLDIGEPSAPLGGELRPDQIELLERYEKSSPEIRTALLQLLAPLADQKDKAK